MNMEELEQKARRQWDKVIGVDRCTCVRVRRCVSALCQDSRWLVKGHQWPSPYPSLYPPFFVHLSLCPQSPNSSRPLVSTLFGHKSWSHWKEEYTHAHTHTRAPTQVWVVYSWTCVRCCFDTVLLNNVNVQHVLQAGEGCERLKKTLESSAKWKCVCDILTFSGWCGNIELDAGSGEEKTGKVGEVRSKERLINVRHSIITAAVNMYKLLTYSLSVRRTSEWAWQTVRCFRISPPSLWSRNCSQRAPWLQSKRKDSKYVQWEGEEHKIREGLLNKYDNVSFRQQASQGVGQSCPFNIFEE